MVLIQDGIESKKKAKALTEGANRGELRFFSKIASPLLCHPHSMLKKRTKVQAIGNIAGRGEGGGAAATMNGVPISFHSWPCACLKKLRNRLQRITNSIVHLVFGVQTGYNMVIENRKQQQQQQQRGFLFTTVSFVVSNVLC